MPSVFSLRARVALLALLALCVATPHASALRLGPHLTMTSAERTVTVGGTIGPGAAVTVHWGDSATAARRCTARGVACALALHHRYRAGRYVVRVLRARRAYRATVTFSTSSVGAVVDIATASAPSPAAASASPVSGWQAEMLSLVNAQRAARGASPLRYCAALERPAQAYAQTMLERSWFDHTGPDGSTSGDRVRAAGYAWSTTGENIATGQTSVADVMAAWVASPGHLANIVEPAFVHVGFGAARSAVDPTTTYWVQEFGAGGTC